MSLRLRFCGYIRMDTKDFEGEHGSVRRQDHVPARNDSISVENHEKGNDTPLGLQGFVMIRRWARRMEACAALVAAWILVFIVPFPRMVAYLGQMKASGTPQDETSPRNEDRIQIERASYVGRRVTRIAHRVPWTTTCLVQAVAGFLLLKRRGIASTIQFGVNLDHETFAAHAWLLVGDKIILGKSGASTFHPLADLEGLPKIRK